MFKRLWENPLTLGFVVVAGGLVYFAFGQKWNGIDLTLAPQDLLTKLTPLILTAAFLERAVEILISPWRDAGAAQLHRAVDAIQARPANPANPVQTAANAADLAAANAALDQYKGETQRYAFAASLIMSFCAAAAGLRALAPFLSNVKIFDALDWHQQSFFRNFDVLVTTALLAGGADGFHGIISSISDFFPPRATTTTTTTTGK